jgi:hypothetical protein
MAWFAVCMLGVLKILGIIQIPIQWVVVACGVALIFDMTQRGRVIGV